jgi:hypothetical protein
MIGARWEISGGNRVPLTLATFPNARIPNETKTPHAAERERNIFGDIPEKCEKGVISSKVTFGTFKEVNLFNSKS